MPRMSSFAIAAPLRVRPVERSRDRPPRFLSWSERQPTDSVGEHVTDESLTAPVDYAKYLENSGFTLGQISRVLKMKRR
jgi:hypothetical protein